MTSSAHAAKNCPALQFFFAAESDKWATTTSHRPDRRGNKLYG